MNYSFYIYGTPNGYNQYPADNNSTAFQDFAQSNATESQMTVWRKEHLIYYSYLRLLQEKSNNYLGFCLTFNNIYCQNPQKLFTLFDRVFDDVLIKGELLRFDKNKITYTIDKFAEKPLEIERINNFFKFELENNFIRDFTTIPASFKIGNGKISISVRETSSEILATISEFDCVHISNNEKSLSELERTHKMLVDLYAEKQDLETKYRKIVAQKKQYKVVILLCLVLIGCAIGLFTFNKNLQSKDSQINTLNSTVNQQQSKIENLNTNIADLQVKNNTLLSENLSLSNNLQKITADKDHLFSENEQLNSTISDKNSIIRNLESQNNSYISENKNLLQKNSSLSSENSTLKSDAPVWYQATSDAYYYYKKNCNASYESTNCYSPSGQTVKVYKIDGGYGLTEYGWAKISNFKKY